jgi:peptidyl-prolyl cis-trans isomerase C
MAGQAFFSAQALTFRRSWAAYLFALIGAISLVACGRQEAKNDAVLAVVDGFDITSNQFNAELSHMAEAPETASDLQNTTRRQILDAMIDRRILMRAAIREKIDRDPAVVNAVESNKEKILVQAYLRAASFHVSKPSQEEVDDYYQHHPDLFAKRRLFDVAQVIVSSKNADRAFNDIGKSATSLRQITDWLDNHQASYTKIHVTLAAAELPEEMAKQVGRLSNDRPFVIHEDGQSRFCTMQYLGDNPVGESEARAQIENYLVKKKEQEAIAMTIARLRALANVEYRNFPIEADGIDRTVSMRQPGTPPPHAGTLRGALRTAGGAEAELAHVTENGH